MFSLVFAGSANSAHRIMHRPLKGTGRRPLIHIIAMRPSNDKCYRNMAFDLYENFTVPINDISVLFLFDDRYL